MLQKWTKNLNRKHYVPTKYNRLCSLHFAEEYFEKERTEKKPGRRAERGPMRTKIRLKPIAIPHIFEKVHHHFFLFLVKRRSLESMSEAKWTGEVKRLKTNESVEFEAQGNLKEGKAQPQPENSFLGDGEVDHLEQIRDRLTVENIPCGFDILHKKKELIFCLTEIECAVVTVHAAVVISDEMKISVSLRGKPLPRSKIAHIVNADLKIENVSQVQNVLAEVKCWLEEEEKGAVDMEMPWIDMVDPTTACLDPFGFLEESQTTSAFWQPTSKQIWQGRIDLEEGSLGRRWHQEIQCLTKPEWPHGGSILLGFACDEGVHRNQGRVGAAGGPQSIRKALARLPWHGNLVAESASDAIFDGGTIVFGDHCDSTHDAIDLAQVQQVLADVITGMLQVHARPLVLGGGHEVAFGSFLGLAQWALQQPQLPKIAILNFDAHFDLCRPGAAGSSSGTPFYQMAQWCEEYQWPFHYGCLGISRWANTQALFERAKNWQVGFRLDTQLTEGQMTDTIAWLDSFMAPVDWLYLSINMDVFPAAVVPGVSAPAPMGVSPGVVEHLIGYIRQRYGDKLMLVDVAELNPIYDHDGMSASVAAWLVASLMQ